MLCIICQIGMIKNNFYTARDSQYGTLSDTNREYTCQSVKNNIFQDFQGQNINLDSKSQIGMQVSGKSRQSIAISNM